MRRHLRGDDARHRGGQAGRPVGDIGHAIQTYVEAQRFSVVRDFSGHGLGRIFHDAPNILHYGKAGTGPVLKPGMFFTVEPMVNVGTWQVKILSDGWTAVTRDKQLSAQFEHSVGITETGVRVLHAVADRVAEAAVRYRQGNGSRYGVSGDSVSFWIPGSGSGDSTIVP